MMRKRGQRNLVAQHSRKTSGFSTACGNKASDYFATSVADRKLPGGRAEAKLLTASAEFGVKHVINYVACHWFDTRRRHLIDRLFLSVFWRGGGFGRGLPVKTWRPWCWDSEDPRNGRKAWRGHCCPCGEMRLHHVLLRR